MKILLIVMSLLFIGCEKDTFTRQECWERGDINGPSIEPKCLRYYGPAPCPWKLKTDGSCYPPERK